MSINTKHRTGEIEIMDDFLLAGEELRVTLDGISKINQFLGGNSITLDGVKKLLSGADKSKSISIIDIGCGNGDMLRMLSDYGYKNKINLNLLGVDANQYTVNYAQSLSKDYSNVSYLCADIFDTDFENNSYDIVLCTLTIHHFDNEKIIELIDSLIKISNLGIVINDLQRSKVAYRLFQAIGVFFRLNKMTRADGLISILRGFKKYELEQFSKTLQLKSYTIQWKWAFRYQWIISNI
ncbi:methyltransferase domain-containing protein [Sphingobacterium sp.]|uniref:methyltransferase domain-containing protein n=1 Tax=Sphingobacterium sp. TaxID=341027 RepID=UPI0031E03692